MGNLSNLYISQSFQSLIHLGTDTTASATLAELQDGYGNSIGIGVNTSGDLYLSGSLTASLKEGNILVGNSSGKTYNVPTSSFSNNSSFNAFTQSFNSFTQSTNTYTASNNAKWQNLDSVSSSWLTESETSSFARTNVSNIFTADQTIQGTLNVDIINATTIHTLIESSSIIFSSGSNILGDSILDRQTLNGTIIVSGSEQVTGSLSVSNEISSSTINGIGNVTTYSASVDNRISSSVANFNAYTTSLNISVSNLNAFSSSTIGRLNTLESKTGSYATTGSNTFIGNEVITGSIIITGSAYGNIIPLSIVSNTASIDMSASNFFTLTLASGTTTRLAATNIKAGQTVSLLITQPSTSGSLNFTSNFQFPYNNQYTASSANTKDILTFITFSDSIIYSAPINNLV